MGAYWGTSYIAVTRNTKEAFVAVVDRYPCPHGNSDKDLLPLPFEYRGFTSFDNEGDAAKKVKLFILQETHEPLLTTLMAIEHNKLVIQELRHTDHKEHKLNILARQLENDELAIKLKELRSVRKRKVEIRL